MKDSIFSTVIRQKITTSSSSLTKIAEQFGLEYADALSLAKQIEPSPESVTTSPVRMGLLGPGNLQLVNDLVAKLGRIHGLDLALKVCDYDSQLTTILNPESFIYLEPLDALVLMSDPGPLQTIIANKSDSKIDEQIDSAVTDFLRLIDILRTKTKCRLIVGNLNNVGYDYPGPRRSQLDRSLYRAIKTYNQRLSEKLDKGILLLDLEFLAQKFGSLKASNDRDWVYGKIPFSPNFSVCVAQELIQLVLFESSEQIKLIILDLDETIWGGSLAEQGAHSIELGGIGHRGEGFKLLQQFLKQLKDSGVMLAVSSKNNKDAVCQILKEHPEMVLRYDDFVSIQANWDPKSENVNKILNDLHIHPSHTLFIDDNPIEIFEVTRRHEEIQSLQAAPEPTDTLSRLREFRGLWIDSESSTDQLRTEQYHTEQIRESERSKFQSMDQFLKSLCIKAKIEPFTEQNLSRITQLIQRSNQFNLNSHRKTELDIRRILESPNYQHFSIRLMDRYGDYGIVAAVIGEVKDASAFSIETWLMSCRVLNRRVEDLTLRVIELLAQNLGCVKLAATYVPSGKNWVVEKTLPEFSFKEVSKTSNGIFYEKELGQQGSFKQDIPIEVLGGNHGV